MNHQDLYILCAETQCSIGGVNWKIFSGEIGDGYFIQLRYVEPDVETGDPQDQHGRKWYVSKHSTKSEVVQTILKACLTSAEHMVREHFTYREARIFSPHYDVDRLVELASKPKDVRIPMPPKEPTRCRETFTINGEGAKEGAHECGNIEASPRHSGHGTGCRGEKVHPLTFYCHPFREQG